MAKKRDPKRLELCRRIQREFGARFRSVRKEARLGQKQVSARMSLTRTTISNIERGKQRVYLDQLFEAAHLFDVPVEALLPRVQDVFDSISLRIAADAPLTPAAAIDAARVVRDVLGAAAQMSSRVPRSRNTR